MAGYETSRAKRWGVFSSFRALGRRIWGWVIKWAAAQSFVFCRRGTLRDFKCTYTDKALGTTSLVLPLRLGNTRVMVQKYHKEKPQPNLPLSCELIIFWTCYTNDLGLLVILTIVAWMVYLFVYCYTYQKVILNEWGQKPRERPRK
jgi:hypothetical protein